MAIRTTAVVRTILFLLLILISACNDEKRDECKGLVACDEEFSCQHVDAGPHSTLQCMYIAKCDGGPWCATYTEACELQCGGTDDCTIVATFPMRCCDCDSPTP